MKVIICGGRDYLDYEDMWRVLDSIHNITPITEVIEGGAKGADRGGNQWARLRGIPITTVHADWDTHGKRAGWIRNNQMADLEPNIVIAFPGGKGTQMMIDIAKRRKIAVIEV